MAQFCKAVITQKGLALIQKAQMQNIKIEFSKITTGAGEYTEDEELGNLVELKAPKQEVPISSVSVIDPQTVKLVSVLSNDGLQQPYYMREIGVYAHDPDVGEILYSLTVAYADKADYIPAYDSSMPVSFEMNIYQKVANSENTVIRADTGAYAPASGLESAIEDIESILDALLNLDEIENQFRIVYFGGGNYPEEDSETMTTEDIESAISTVWAGESSEDETAMTAEDVEASINTEWNGESSEDESALSATDVENATK